MGEIEELVRQARILLHGGPEGAKPKGSSAKRAERERELEAALEKTDWYQKEIKKLRQELKGRDRLCGGPNDPGDRDPMELQNLLTEKTKELQRVRKTGEGLDRIAEVQRKAEVAQNALSPEIEQRLRFMKNEVEHQKRQNVRLQTERQKVTAARKKAEEEVRTASSELRSKAAQLQKPPRPGAGGAAGASKAESNVLRQLRRDVEILKEAARQDERKHRAAQREEAQEVELTSNLISSLKESVAEHEAALAKLRADLRGAGGGKPPLAPDILSPSSQSVSTQPSPITARSGGGGSHVSSRAPPSIGVCSAR